MSFRLGLIRSPSRSPSYTPSRIPSQGVGVPPGFAFVFYRGEQVYYRAQPLIVRIVE